MHFRIVSEILSGNLEEKAIRKPPTHFYPVKIRIVGRRLPDLFTVKIPDFGEEASAQCLR